METNLVKSSNLTQTEIAKGIGITQQAVSSFKHGRISPDLETLIKIAEFFDVPTDYLLTGVRAENKPVQEILKLSDKAIENLKFLSTNVEFFDELLSDDDFKNTIYQVLHFYVINLILSKKVEKMPVFLENGTDKWIGGDIINYQVWRKNKDNELDLDVCIMTGRYSTFLESLKNNSMKFIKKYFDNFLDFLNKSIEKWNIPESTQKEIQEIRELSKDNYRLLRERNKNKKQSDQTDDYIPLELDLSDIHTGGLYPPK